MLQVAGPVGQTVTARIRCAENCGDVAEAKAPMLSGDPRGSVGLPAAVEVGIGPDIQRASGKCVRRRSGPQGPASARHWVRSPRNLRLGKALLWPAAGAKAILAAPWGSGRDLRRCRAGAAVSGDFSHPLTRARSMKMLTLVEVGQF